MDGLSGVSPILQQGPPSFATAQGITNLLFFDDFQSSSVIDLANTKADGFNWYLPNFTTYEGTSGYTVPDSAFFTVSGSVMRQSSSTAISNGLEFATKCYLGTSAPRWSGLVPLINGAKPFYMEVSSRFKLPVGVNFVPAAWIQDLTGIQNQIDNVSPGTKWGEIDIYEGKTASIIQTVHEWNTSTSSTQSSAAITLSNWNATAFHKWGIMVIPVAYGGGTGSIDWYLDRVSSRSQVTWVANGTYSRMETSQFAMMLDTGVNLNHEVDYVAVWNYP